MVIDGNSYLANLAVDGLEPTLAKRIKTISSGELGPDKGELHQAIEQAPIIVVDVMGKELEEYLNKNIDLKGKTVYALRGSHDD